ncbi:YjjG family noncanonical pyrimidine nucleotidase [Falsibacillus pallidus]|uniref:YjjG family noncanonical pyrimidine nucleotidase n=1 Tax=Falsibacillus pallidus TaxID=493781 RepID=UPI003D963EFF
MKKYTTLFFDIDDTLLDFGAAEKSALEKLFNGQGIPYTPENIAAYKQINQGLWRAYEDGTIEQQEVVNTRFSRFFETHGKSVDGTLLENQYRSYLEDGEQVMNTSLEFIEALRKDFDLYIVTNGLTNTQDKRLRAAGLHPLFKEVFVSEAIGHQKPKKEFFDYVFNRIPGFIPERGLIIGDSLTSDMKGGYMAGMDTCWFNPGQKPNPTDIVPTYEIKSLDELVDILQLKAETADC